MIPDHVIVPEGLEVRLTEEEDGKYLKEWLSHPSVNRWFPMCTDEENTDAVARWIIFHRYKCSLTAVMHGVPCGITTLYLQPYRKLTHQCEFGIIVSHQFRNNRVGSVLLECLMKLARENFNIEVLHLQVYAENPAIRLYKRFGFREFGRQTHFIKEGDSKKGNSYVGRILMEKFLVSEVGGE
ncbi:MAG: hypothetical protein Tsb0021_13480 [Chlamydiales bacterium]